MLATNNNVNNTSSAPVVVNAPGSAAAPIRILAESDRQGFSLNLQELWRRLMRQKALFLTVLLLTLLSAALMTWSMTPHFRAVSTVQIEKQSAKVVDFGELNQTTPDLGELDPFFRTQYEQLKSRELAQQVIDKLNLEQRLFKHNFDTPLKQALSQRFHFMFKTPLDWVRSWIETLSSDGKKKPATDDPVDTFLKKLYVEPVEKTHLVKVYYETPDAGLSAEVVNTLVKTFIHEALKTAGQNDTYAQTFLELELNKARERLTSSEEQLVQYARDNNILEVNNSQQSQEKKLTDLTAALSTAEQQKLAADTKAEQARLASSVVSNPVRTSPTVEGLKQQLAEREAEYQNQLKIFKPAYPGMQQLAGEVATLRSRVATETAAFNATLAAERAALEKDKLNTALNASTTATSLVKRLRSELAAYRDELTGLRDRSVEYNALQRELETNRKLYEDLLKRNNEVNIATGANTSNMRVVDAAQPPVKDFRPDKPLNMLFGLIAGLLLASALALLRETFSNSLSSTAELEKLSGLPILGTVPYVNRLNQHKLPLAALRDVGSSVAESYRIAATNLKFALSGQGSRIFLVTSVNPAAGKSTSSVNLALSKAQIGNKVLLIDADFRRPTVHDKMELNNNLGLSEYLQGDIELSKATQHFAEGKNTFVITVGMLNLDPVEALSCERMVRLVGMARKHFDVTIIDAPPVTGFADTLLLAEYADATVIITDEQIDRNEMSHTLARLQRIKKNVAGFLVLKAKVGGVSERYYQRYQQRPVSSSAPLMTAPQKTGGLNLAR